MGESLMKIPMIMNYAKNRITNKTGNMYQLSDST